MVHIQIPGKIVLFGEWSVLKGAPGIAIAVNRFCESKIKIPPQSTRFQKATWKSPLHEAQFPSKEDKDSSFLAKLLELSLRKNPPSTSLEMETKFLWNVNDGLGSSSALVLSALSLIEGLTKKNATESYLLWIRAREVQQALQNGKSSGLDLAAQIFGNAVILQNQKIDALELQLPKELLFLHSGKKFSTAQALASDVPSGLYKDLAQSTERFLRDAPKLDWERAISEHKVAFEKAQILDADVKALETALNRAKISHVLKSCGAGGSETVMIHADPSKHEKIVSLAQSLNFRTENYLMAKDGVVLS